ncbi:MAG: AarF/ABC1/UbiB kinase family protein, partial [archaeon]|nr:AarF/ABC1/UbiB kinase family protein [archaeon]
MNVRKRFFKTATIIFKIYLDFRKEFFLIKKKGYKYAQVKMEKIHEKRAKELYDMAITLKGSHIKMCQYLSARPDFFPEPYIKILSKLQDDVPPVEFEQIEKLINEEYNDYTQYFKEIHKEPIASASLAQVHKAVLHNGKVVALKILKPGIERVIDIDFAIFFHVFKILSNVKILRERNDFTNIMNSLLDDFFVVTGNELDFKREAYIITQFRIHFKKFDYLKIPYVYHQYSTEKIIVMEFIEGDKINDGHLWKKRNNDPEIIASRLIEIYVYQVLFSKLVHYDPHPGNIFITDNNGIALLDFGMSGEITEKMQNGIWTILEASVIKDYRKVLDTIEDLGFIRKGVHKYSLLPLVEYFFTNIIDVIRLDREALHTIDLSPIRDELLNVVTMDAFNFPSNWVFLGKTAGT